jgi:ribose-phosphate pyrophosphokinase
MTPSETGPVLFAPSCTAAFGDRVAAELRLALSPLEERHFEDGEHKTRPLVAVRNRHVFVIQSLHGDERESPNDKLCRLLFLIAALKDASAAEVTALVPYLAYARKDRKTQSDDPVSTQYVARLFEAVGTDRVVTLEVHNLAAFQNAFRCRSEHLEAHDLFAAALAGDLTGDVVVVSPDSGGAKRADLFRIALSRRLGRPVPLAFLEKQRHVGKVTGELIVGDVAGRAAVIIDDMISTGGTMLHAVRACARAGATAVYAAAAHGLFMPGAEALVGEPLLSRLLVTNTVPPFRLHADLARRVTVVDCAVAFADSVRRSVR